MNQTMRLNKETGWKVSCPDWFTSFLEKPLRNNPVLLRLVPLLLVACCRKRARNVPRGLGSSAKGASSVAYLSV